MTPERKCSWPNWSMSIATNAWRKDQFSESGKVGVEMEIRDRAAAVEPGAWWMSVSFSEILWLTCTRLQLPSVSKTSFQTITI